MRRLELSSLIKIREGEARKILHEIKAEFNENYFDFIFIDADKESYIEYFDLCLPLVRKGGIIGADNILVSRKVQRDDGRLFIPC